jgi:hypothetical protein
VVAIQQTPENRPSDDAGEVETEDDEAHSRTRAGQLQHEPEQSDDGELVPEIRNTQPSQSRWNAGWRNGTVTVEARAMTDDPSDLRRFFDRNIGSFFGDRVVATT